MTGVEDIPTDAALLLQVAAIIGNEPAASYVEIRPLHPNGRPAIAARQFVPVAVALQRVPELVAELSRTLNVFLGVCPRTRQDGTSAAVARAWTLWADVDGEAALHRALDVFEPMPSIILRTGSGGGHCYWPLKSSLAPAMVQRCNRRLALALDGDMAATDPARILRPAGSVNHKHAPPRPVVCERLELDVFEASAVVGHLRDTVHYAPRRSPAPRVRDAAPDRVLDGLVRVVREAEVGTRNERLFWAVNRALEHADDGKLDEYQALEDLRAAGLQAGLTEHEVTATIRSAVARRSGAAA